MAAEGTRALVARAVGCPVGDEREGEPRPAGDDQFYPSCSVSAANLSADTRGDGDFQWRHLSMVEMEMDAAQVLANFAQIAFLEREAYGLRGGERDDCGGNTKEAGPTKGAKNGPLEGDVSRDHPQERCNSKLNPSPSFRAQENPSCGEDSECMETKKIDTENAFGLEQTSGSPSRMFSSCESRGKQTLTEAEKEAKRLRRVLANRESARKTIFRRQARFEELAKRASELSLENEKIKMEKALLMEEYSSLRGTNIRLREQMARLNFEVKEDPSGSASIKPESPTPSSTISSLVAFGISPLPQHSAELQTAKLLSSTCHDSQHASFFRARGACSLQTSGTLVPQFPWLFPVYYPPASWSAYSAHGGGEEGPKEREKEMQPGCLSSKSTEDLGKDDARISRSTQAGGPTSGTSQVVNVKRESEEVQPEGWRGPCRARGKLVAQSAATEARKRRKELARRGRKS